MSFDKLIIDGKTAVMFSPGFGAGWSSWSANERAAHKCMDKDLAEAVLARDHEKMAAIAKEKWPEDYAGGLHDLCVEWVPTGSFFEVHEYDGNESLRVLGQIDFMQA